MSYITQLLVAAREGDTDAGDRLLPLVYDHLHRIAHRQLRRMRMHETLNTTALVHEAYLKLVQHTRVTYEDRVHFFAVSARAMRFILVDYARRHRAQRRGGDWQRVTLEEALTQPATRLELLLDLDEALNRLGELDERLVQVVEYHFFAGLSQQEIADKLGVSVRTVRRDWIKAKAWLTRELRAYDPDPPNR
ncbi:MAG: sigma-70 family RNA polymerase sigma factor [Bacteroidetes bacterium]|nr:MAG: sigma-70 family RNA polymerase sigma factor [Bacteroidota bacterium]